MGNLNFAEKLEVFMVVLFMVLGALGGLIYLFKEVLGV